jgi:hypothetical protein
MEADFDRRETAYHEAGHAVVAIALGETVEEVAIADRHEKSLMEDDEGCTGYTRWGATPFEGGEWSDQFRDRIAILAAGYIACRLAGLNWMEKALDDHDTIRRRLSGLEDWSGKEKNAEKLAYDTLARHRAALDAVAAQLLERGRLSGFEVGDIIERADAES